MRLYFLVVQFIPFTTVSIQYYYNNAFFHKIGLKKDNETPIITHIIVVASANDKARKPQVSFTCERLAVLKCVDDFHWLKPNMEFVYIRPRLVPEIKRRKERKWTTGKHQYFQLWNFDTGKR